MTTCFYGKRPEQATREALCVFRVAKKCDWLCCGHVIAQTESHKMIPVQYQSYPGSLLGARQTRYDSLISLKTSSGQDHGK